MKEREVFLKYRIYHQLRRFCKNGESAEVEPGNLGLTAHGISLRPDLYFPHGCAALNLKEKTILDIHSEWDLETIQLIRNIHDSFYNVIRQNGYHFLFVILYSRYPDLHVTWRRIKEQSLGRIHDDFDVITYEELLKKASHKSSNNKIKSDIQDAYQQALKNATSAIMSEQCSFILGAGVSSDAGLPGWEKLLKTLIETAKRKHNLQLCSDDYELLFKDCGSSSIILGRLVQTLFNNDAKDFNKAIQQSLYSGEEKQPGKLAMAVCKLIKYKYKHKSLTSIITYNYDDLIERGLKKNRLLSIPVYGTQRQKQYIPVFHVHGFMPQDGDIGSEIVLSEQEYHDIYKAAYHWSNVEQLHAMQRSVCFFIGLSMTDPNLRRLLDIAYGERNEKGYRDIRHFAFLRRDDVSKDLTGQKAMEFRIKMEDMLKGPGVAVIWYDEYNELPDILNSLIETT